MTTRMITTKCDPVSGSPPEPLTGVRYIVVGRVQGVGYRAWTRRTALRYGIIGTVRNLPDGSVRIDAAADPVTLAAFHAELHAGPSGAIVTSVTAAEVALPATTRFEIEY